VNTLLVRVRPTALAEITARLDPISPARPRTIRTRGSTSSAGAPDQGGIFRGQRAPGLALPVAVLG
jgi:hypothetical protein